MILIVAALALGIHHAGAQYVTYNHDETKMNQVTVMETGAGSLTPALFYSLIHNRYYQTASATNKLSYRLRLFAGRPLGEGGHLADQAG